MGSGFVEAGDARLHYVDAGKGDAVVFLHAGIADLRMWDPQVPAFADAYRVVCYDARGYGRTEAPVGPYVPHEDLFAVMDDLGIERAHLVGGSMGGATAIDAALADPPRVAGLVLAAPGLGGYSFTDPATIAKWPEIEAAFEKGDYDRVVDLELRMWLAGPRRRLEDLDPGIVANVRTMLRESYPASARLELRRPKPAAIERLSEIGSSTLVLVGNADVPDMMRIADLVAGGVLRALKVVISGIAHLPNMERPAEFNALALGHLDGARDEPG
jgi:pimeloyl-ACP methyl ester carboxylesterase